MTAPTSQRSEAAQQFTWLLASFADETPGVRETVTISASGSLLAMSGDLSRPDADRLAAISSAVASLTGGAGRVYQLGQPAKVVVDLDHGYLLVNAIGFGAMLGVVATKEASLGDLGYALAIFTNEAAAVMSTQLIAELESGLSTRPAANPT